ncbi:MAG: c-type cytochrome, partial [Verrucomicrobiota bacterium]
EGEMAAFIQTQPTAPTVVSAARVLLRNQGETRKLLAAAGDEEAMNLYQAIGLVGDRTAAGVLSGELGREGLTAGRQRSIVSAMAVSTNGGKQLVKLAETGKLDPSLHLVASSALARSTNGGLRQAATTKFQVPAAQGTEKFPSVAALIAKDGDAKVGEVAFNKAACSSCHQVKGTGVNFGPDLTEIGSKLSREGLYEAILYPNAAISHGYHGVVLTMKDGNQFSGFMTGETDEELTLRLAGGVNQSFSRLGVKEQRNMDQSLMPAGLVAVLVEDELRGLVQYLEELKAP